MFMPILILFMPLSFCFFAISPYTGPKQAPMSKMSLYGSRQTSQLMPLTKWYCHSLFILPTSFIVHEHGPLAHNLQQQNPINLDSSGYILQPL